MRSARLRSSMLGFGGLVRRRLTAEETLPWVTPYLPRTLVCAGTSPPSPAAGPGRDLAGSESWLRPSRDRCSSCWARRDRFFKLALGRRLQQTFPDARLVEVDDALTFLALDQPALLADEIAGFAGETGSMTATTG